MAGEAGELAFLIERARGRPLETCPYYAAALLYAERWRRRCGLAQLRALPPGEIGSAAENPLARALGPGASAERWWARLRHPDGRIGTVALPGAVEAFLDFTSVSTRASSPAPRCGRSTAKARSTADGRPERGRRPAAGVRVTGGRELSPRPLIHVLPPTARRTEGRSN